MAFQECGDRFILAFSNALILCETALRVTCKVVAASPKCFISATAGHVEPYGKATFDLLTSNSHGLQETDEYAIERVRHFDRWCVPTVFKNRKTGPRNAVMKPQSQFQRRDPIVARLHDEYR